LEVVGRIGGTPRVVSSGVAGDDLPEWSPDSRRLAVVRRGTITIVDLKGAAARELVRGTTPSWSPDGKGIAFTRGSHMYVVGVDSAGERRLGFEGSINVVPKFSPDEKSIAFETTGGALDILSGKVGIGVVSADGSDTETVVTDAADYPPVWSPDGSSLLYIRGVDEHRVRELRRLRRPSSGRQGHGDSGVGRTGVRRAGRVAEAAAGVSSVEKGPRRVGGRPSPGSKKLSRSSL
jgi:Tol biopolymer transport system component